MKKENNQIRKRTMQALILVFAVSLLNSCTKPGLGGGNVIAAFPQHHGKAIFGDTVYVKFNAVELPGTKPGDFDMRIIGDTAENHCHINGLKPGNYFIYAVGWDPSIKQEVRGGIGIKLTAKMGETEVFVPVTE